MCSVICIPLLNFSGQVIERHLAYQVYFYVYWTSYALEAILSLLVIYSIFKLAMAPLKGLQTLGMLIFRWVAAISVAVAIGVAVSPHQSGIKFMTAMITQLQQTSSILTLCLLLFVCFAIRPMGLSFRSRIFGISLGLGFLATINLSTRRGSLITPTCTPLFSLINGRRRRPDAAHVVRLLSPSRSRSAALSCFRPPRLSFAGTRSRWRSATIQAMLQSAASHRSSLPRLSLKSCVALRQR